MSAGRGPAEAQVASELCRRCLADGYFYNAARRMRGTSVYQTLAQPPQVLALGGGGSAGGGSGAGGGGGGAGGGGGGAGAGGFSEAHGGGFARLRGAEYVIFSELAWAGRAVMTKASAVEWAWIAPLMPRLEQVDVEYLLSGRRKPDDKPTKAQAKGVKRGAPEEGEEATDGANAPVTATRDSQPGASRRNDSAAVEAARRRFVERKRKQV